MLLSDAGHVSHEGHEERVTLVTLVTLVTCLHTTNPCFAIGNVRRRLRVAA